jgi:hypothetical protein
MSTLKTLEKPVHFIRFGCVGSCKKYHDVQIACDDAERLFRELDDWDHKHSKPTCRKVPPVFLRRDIPRDFDDSEFEQAGYAPWWLDPSVHGLGENTSFQTTFTAGAAFTMTSWATLASDSSLLAGASTATIDLGSSGAPLQVSVSCQIKNGTTPTTGKEIDVYAWTKQCDDSTYPDAITGFDAAISITGTDAINNALSQVWSFASTTTTGSTYPTGWHTGRMVDVGRLFGRIPRYLGLWCVHNTVAAFASGSVANYNGLYVAA